MSPTKETTDRNYIQRILGELEKTESLARTVENLCTTTEDRIVGPTPEAASVGEEPATSGVLGEIEYRLQVVNRTLARVEDTSRKIAGALDAVHEALPAD